MRFNPMDINNQKLITLTTAYSASKIAKHKEITQRDIVIAFLYPTTPFRSYVRIIFPKFFLSFGIPFQMPQNAPVSPKTAKRP